MTKKCFNCELLFNKKSGAAKNAVLPKECPDCKKLAPRQSLRPFNSPKKPKRGK